MNKTELQPDLKPVEQPFLGFKNVEVTQSKSEMQ